MVIEEKIRPINDDHSIKEAVISVFLASPIIKPERFQKLIETKYNSIFHQFETLVQVEFKVHGQGGAVQNTAAQILNNRGFKFSAFNKGKLQKVIQGLNDTSRTFISYHCLEYNRWENFREDYLKYIASIIEYQPGIFITGVSLHYIDEFLWEEPQLEDVNLIFDSNCSYLSKEFFNSLKLTYLLEKNLDQHTKYLDRLQISVEPNIRPFISISHNITQPLSELTELQNFIKEERFDSIMSPAHEHNKKLLKCLLKPEIQKMINLP